jgi:hypothetical protein
LTTWELIGNVGVVVGLVTGAVPTWNYLRSGATWALSLSRKNKIAKLYKSIKLLDQLYADAVLRQCYIAGRTFDLLTMLGASLMLLLLTAAGSAGVTASAIVASVVGLIAYLMGLDQSLLMRRLRAYDQTRESLCGQIIKLGGVPPDKSN